MANFESQPSMNHAVLPEILLTPRLREIGIGEEGYVEGSDMRVDEHGLCWLNNQANITPTNEGNRALLVHLSGVGYQVNVMNNTSTWSPLPRDAFEETDWRNELIIWLPVTQLVFDATERLRFKNIAFDSMKYESTLGVEEG